MRDLSAIRRGVLKFRHEVHVGDILFQDNIHLVVLKKGVHAHFYGRVEPIIFAFPDSVIHVHREEGASCVLASEVVQCLGAEIILHEAQ